MHPYCTAVPRMPAIVNLTHIPNMGVALLSCIIARETTKGWPIESFFPRPVMWEAPVLYRGGSDWAAC
jgi:hypothetical protein